MQLQPPPFTGRYSGGVKRIIPLAALPLLAALAIVPASSATAAPVLRADTSDFSFESFHADYTLTQDSDGLAELEVVETIVAVFPDFDQNRGILRTIPKYYGNVPLDLSDFAVHDENGDDVYFEQADVDTSYDGSNSYEHRAVELALGTDDYVHGRTTYVISYTAHNVVRNFADTGNDEFYWDVNGTEWPQTFGQVSVDVHVADELVGSLTGLASCYQGSYEQETRCDIANPEPGQYSASVSHLGAFSNVTVAVEFDGDVFVQPDVPQNSWIITSAPFWLFIAAIALLIAAMVVRFAIWRDASGRGIIIPQYTTPESRNLLEAGDLIEHESTAMAAQFVDLAVRGLVQVVDLYPDAAAYGIKDRYALDFVTTDGATAAELKILNILFDDLEQPGERKQLGSLDASVGAALHEQTAKARRDTIKNGLRAQPAGSVDAWLRRTGFVIFSGYAAIFIWTFAVDVDAGPMLGFAIGSIVVLLIASAILSKPYLLSRSGAESWEYLVGLRDYLRLAEEDRLRVLQSPQGADRVVATDRRAIVKLHEKLLPYAVLWGVEKEWSRQLEVEYQAVAETPSWIGNDLTTVNFSRMLSDFSLNSTTAVRPLAPPPSSSGGGGGSSWSSGGGSSFSSGSSGGGFSGGGGGGGGGGGR